MIISPLLYYIQLIYCCSTFSVFLNLFSQIIRPRTMAKTIAIPLHDMSFPKPTINKVVHAPPSIKTEIDVAPSIAKLADFAAEVSNGAIHDAIYNDTAISITPPITILNTLPPNTAAITAIINGIVAKSPNGKTLFTGRITASNNETGTKINEAYKSAS